ASLEDAALLACKRLSAADMWAPTIDRDALFETQLSVLAAVISARARSVAPSSEEAAVIVEDFVRKLAAAAGESVMVIRARMRVKYDPIGARHWELVSIMRGDVQPARFDDWRWLGEAIRHS